MDVEGEAMTTPDVGYWNAPCGIDILTTDGTATTLAEHVRSCDACKEELVESLKGPYVQISGRVRVSERVAKRKEKP